MPLRHNVETTVPHQMQVLGFVAFVSDAGHPDMGPGDAPRSVSWHQSLFDAHLVRFALEQARRALPRPNEAMVITGAPYHHHGVAHIIRCRLCPPRFRHSRPTLSPARTSPRYVPRWRPGTPDSRAHRELSERDRRADSRGTASLVHSIMDTRMIPCAAMPWRGGYRGEPMAATESRGAR
jgi:hypothetical protein